MQSPVEPGQARIVRACTSSDVQAICDIYNYYIANTVISFEEQPLAVDEIIRRVNACTARYPWLVSEVNGTVAGYAYAGLWLERSAYRHSAIVSVYIRDSERGKGHGSALYQALLTELGKTDCHAVVAGIALPNDASVRLHEQCGFVKVAHFSEVGWKFGRWVDVGYWQKVLA